MCLLLVMFFTTYASAVTITDTTFFSSSSGSTIFIDTITLDEVTVTDVTTLFTNLTSSGSEFTNTNTSDASADFIGLQIGLVIRNLNTSTDLFQARTGSQTFNATFTQGQVLKIMPNLTFVCNAAQRSILNLTVLFFALAIMFIPILFLFIKGKLSLKSDPKVLMIVFVGVIMGTVFVQVIANSVVSFCG